MKNIEFFDAAVKKSKMLSERPSNKILLKLYALYKQTTVGDIIGKRPSGFDFKGAAKYDAWEKEKGKNKEKTASEYIELINSLF